MSTMEPSPSGGVHGTELLRCPGLVMLLSTPKGRGVFASRPIAAQTVVEVCPVVVLPPADVHAIATTILNDYTYRWPGNAQAMVLGLGSMFNHSTLEQNVGWTRDLQAQCITYTALRPIAEGEELCINYGRLWFADCERSADGGGTGISEELDVFNGIQYP